MYTMYLKLTESCNMKCPFCYINQKDNKMTLDIALTAIDKYKPKKIVFHGGEPLLEKKLILSILKERPEYNYSITTNLTVNIDKDIKYILRKCSVATSYSYDRFPDKELYKKFKNNFKKVLKLNNITLLVTLTKEQIRRPIEELGNVIKELNPTNITLERVRLDNITDIEEYKSLYEDTDNYLFDIFSNNIIPIEKNNLYYMIERSIIDNTTTFNINCDKNTITVNPDGSTLTCPNGLIKKSKLRECLNCDIYQYCKGDCQSFSNISCSFPKKTLKYIEGNVINGVKNR